MGNSLGTAVAGYVAKHRNASSLLLMCPIHSVKKIAIERYFALSAAIKHSFQLYETAKDIKADTLVIVAGNDAIVPNSHSEITFSNLHCKKAYISIAVHSHNGIFQSQKTIKLINNFI